MYRIKYEKEIEGNVILVSNLRLMIYIVNDTHLLRLFRLLFNTFSFINLWVLFNVQSSDCKATGRNLNSHHVVLVILVQQWSNSFYLLIPAKAILLKCLRPAKPRRTLNLLISCVIFVFNQCLDNKTCISHFISRCAHDTLT